MGRVNDVACRILIDNSSEANFMSAELASKIHCPAKEADELVECPNGDYGPMTEADASVRLQRGERAQHSAFLVTELTRYDVILGDPWLRKRNPRLNWKTRHMLFRGAEGPVALKSINDPDPGCLVSAMQLSRIVKREKPRAFAITAQHPGAANDAVSTIPECAQKALDDFQRMRKSKLPSDPRRSSKHDHSIRLKDGSTPVSRPICKLSHAELKEQREQLAELLEKRLIGPSKSPWTAPALLAPKSSGKLRMRIDYRALNKQTIRSQLPLPLPDDIFDKLSGAAALSKIDLTQGFYQARMRPDSQELAGFRCRRGRFEWRAAPFGLTSAPATFMGFMSDALSQRIDSCALARLDDILIFSKTAEDHALHARKAHEALDDYGLRCHPEKCILAQKSVELLGRIASHDGVSAESAKIQAIKDWPEPQAKLQAQSFIGLASCCRRFARNFAELAKPLTLATGELPFVWASKERSALHRLKCRLASTPALRSFDCILPISVATGASSHAISGALTQKDDNGSRPVAFCSHALNAAQQNCAAREKELLAIVEALKRWRACLHGRRFTVRSDHGPLEHLFEQTSLSQKQARWLEILSQHEFTIKRISGKDNKVADALSRKGESRRLEAGRAALGEARSRCKPTQLLSCAALSNTNTAASLSPAQLADVATQCECDHDFSTVCSSPTDPCKLSNGALCRDNKVCAPDGPLRSVILSDLHDAVTAGHLGQKKTLSKALPRCYWPTLRRDMLERVKPCPRCQRSKPSSSKKSGLLQPLQTPSRKWPSVSMGFLMPLPTTPKGRDGAMALVDRLTKAAALAPIRATITAEGAALKCKEEVRRHCGAAEEIASDRDPKFTSAFWRALGRLLKIDLAMSTSHHPQTDGQTERMSRALEEMARSCIDATHQSWDDLLGDLEFAHNNSVSESAGRAPFFLSCGQHPKTVTECLLTDINAPALTTATDCLRAMGAAISTAREAITKASEKSKKRADRSRRPLEFSVGDQALLSTRRLSLPTPLARKSKFSPKRAGPFTISRKRGALNCKLSLPGMRDCHKVFHADRLRKRHKPADPSREPPPPPADMREGGREELEVEAILSHKLERKRGRLRKGQRQRPQALKLLVKHKGYDASHNQWLTEHDLEQRCKEFLEECRARVGTPLH